MLVTLWLLRYSLTRKATVRAQNMEYVRRSLDSKMRTIAADVDGQRLSQGPMDSGTVIIRWAWSFFLVCFLCDAFGSSSLHASPTCPDNHITVRFFVSTGEYTVVTHIFEKADSEYFLAMNDCTSLKWKNTQASPSSFQAWTLGRSLVWRVALVTIFCVLCLYCVVAKNHFIFCIFASKYEMFDYDSNKNILHTKNLTKYTTQYVQKQ